MSEYRVYRSGEPEPVQGLAAPRRPRPWPRPAACSATPAGAARRRRRRLRALVIWAAVAVAAAIAAVLFWFYGRDMLGNSLAAFDLARLSGKVPGWVVVGMPVVAVAVAAAVDRLPCLRPSLRSQGGRRRRRRGHGWPPPVSPWAGRTAPWRRRASQRGAAGRGRRHRAGAAPRASRRGHEHPAHRLRQDQDPRRHRALGHADPRAPRPRHQEHLHVLGAARPARADPRPRLRQDEHGLLLRRPAARRQDVHASSPACRSTTSSRSISPASGTWSTSSAASTSRSTIATTNPESADYKSIDISPGYQLIRGHDALDFVRFRHDQLGDFTRMQRQQLFLKEMQRQSDALERGLDEGPAPHQGDHRRDDLRHRLAQASPAARRADLPGRHVQGVHGAPRGLRRP